MQMATIHISEAEAVRDFSGVLARLQPGTEIIIDRVAATAVVVRAAETPRQLSESLRMARERGSGTILFDDAADDLNGINCSDDEPRRRASEILRMAEERGSTVKLDKDFSRDVQAGIDSHPEPLRNPWE